MRFHSTEHLEQWAKSGKFPDIHCDIFNFILQESDCKYFLDLGACFGLLAQRVNEKMPNANCIGVEANKGFIESAKKYGIKANIIHLNINTNTIKELTRIISINKTQAIIARRIMPELWGQNIIGGIEFAREVRDAGIKEIFLQGRAKTKNATNQLHSLEAEIKMFDGIYKTQTKNGDIAKLI